MFLIAENFPPYPARLKRNRTPPHSRCGRIQIYERHNNTRRSNDRRDKPLRKARLVSLRTSNYRISHTKMVQVQRRANSLEAVMNTDLGDRRVWDSCPVALNRRQATSKNFHHSEALAATLDQIEGPE